MMELFYIAKSSLLTSDFISGSNLFQGVDSLQALLVAVLMLILIWNTVKTYRGAKTAAQKASLKTRTIVLCSFAAFVIILMAVLVFISQS